MPKIKNKIYIYIIIFFFPFFLRFYHLSSNPPSLYWEEVALGYDAYSLLETGKDHRGNPWPITYISSYMDYKPPLYVYTLIPSIKLFGLNEFSVRFPSAFFGSLTVIIIYFLAREFFASGVQDKDAPGAIKLGLVSAFLMAISPWHLQFSRAGFEANLALFLVLLGTLFFFISFKKDYFLIFCVFLLSLSLYAYHGARVFTPLLVLLMGIIYLSKLRKNIIFVILAFILGLAITFPLIKTYQSKEIQQRFQETSAFINLEPILESNTKIKEDRNTIFAKIYHHRLWEYSRVFIKNYFTYFNGNYLFLSGDGNPRHSIQEFGELYHWELVILILGLIIIFKNITNKNNQFLLGWLLISPMPGAITVTNPHSLRTIFGLPVFIIISSFGLVSLVNYIRYKKVLLSIVFSLIFIELIIYLHFYYCHYPKLYASEWQDGYKQAMNYVKENQDKYKAIYLTNDYGRAYMYYLFFNKIDPSIEQQLIKNYKTEPDISKIGNVYFGTMPENGSTLWLLKAGEAKEGKFLGMIMDTNKKEVFSIWETK